jgi:hypothetical protein
VSNLLHVEGNYEHALNIFLRLSRFYSVSVIFATFHVWLRLSSPSACLNITKVSVTIFFPRDLQKI